MTANIDINAAQCIQQMNNIGSTVYQNICSGSVHTVPWGTVDWILSVALGIALTSILVLFISMITLIVRGR